MKSSSNFSVSFDARRANLPVAVAVVIALSVVLGMLLTDSTEELIAYLLVTGLCAAPCALWIYAGAGSIPIMAAVAVLHFIYFALPLLRSSLSPLGFTPTEILNGAATVALFLFFATLPWGVLLIGITRRPGGARAEIASGTQLERFIIVGLGLGVLYYVALFSGLLAWLGPNFGFVRAIMLTAGTVGCFLLGHARARGLLQRRTWVISLAAIVALVALSWATLFLVGGMIFCLAAVGGYVISSKRVPWLLASAAVTIVVVLHAGKDDMRTKYWLIGTNYAAEIPVSEVPALMAEWADKGVTALFSGNRYDSLVDRASLQILLLRAHRLAPDYVPFLEGKSYAVLPYMLVPRFINPDKITSQTAMNMLNIHFGFLLPHQTLKTAVGWGLIAEAYANFGRIGVIGMALVFGIVIGFFERWSDGAALTSLPSLVAAAVMMQLLNIELDSAGLITAVLQSAIAISLLFWIFGIVTKQKERRSRGEIARLAGPAE
jgi:hypothetical protein